MSVIEDAILDRFPSPLNLDDASYELDTGLLHISKMVDVIYDLVVHPNQGIDVDSVAAASLSLQAYIGHLGRVVDAVESSGKTSAATGRARAA